MTLPRLAGRASLVSLVALSALAGCTEGGQATYGPELPDSGAATDGGATGDGALPTDSGAPGDSGPSVLDSGADTGTPADAGPAPAGSTAAIADFGANPGGLAMSLHSPGRAAAKAPIVVALHGCGQTAADYANAGWDPIADARGAFVIYAEQTTRNNSSRCFRWYDSAQTGRGGENASIAQMVAWVRANRGATGPAYVTGLSSGGAMAIAALAAYPEVFSAASSFAGIPYLCASSLFESGACLSGTTKTAKAWGDLVRGLGGSFGAARVQLVQGANDSVVSPTNLTELGKQWSNVLGLPEAPTSTAASGPATVRRWSSAGGVRVESWSIAGMDHGVPVAASQGCGRAAPYVLDVGVCGAAIAADYFGL